MAVVVRAQARGVIAHGGAGRLSAFSASSAADWRSKMRLPRTLAADQCLERSAPPPPPPVPATLHTTSAGILSRACRTGGHPRAGDGLPT